MKNILFVLLILTSSLVAQPLVGSSLAGHFDSELGSTNNAGAEATYQSPWKYGSAHVGWSNVSRSSGGVGPTGWLDLGVSLHSSDTRTGIKPGIKVYYSLGLRDGSGWLIKFWPVLQYQTSDDNLLSATIQTEGGSEDLRLAAIFDWQWCWESLVLGPRMGYGFTASKPIVGATIAYRL